MSLNKFPLQGIELLQGIFQFVSRKAHYTPENSRDTSIITMLKKRLHDHPDSLIGGRYRINDQSGVDKKSLSVQNDYQRYLLDVTDT